MARRIDAETLTASQRRILAVLGAIDGAALGVEHVADLADAPDAERELADLERRGWVKGQSPRYRLIRPLPSGLAPPAPAEIADPLLDNLGVWARERATPTTIADEAEAIEAALAIGAGSGRWRAALSLAAAAGSRLPLAGAWAASRRVLSAGLAAARALRRESAEAYFLHQLGSLALLLGESEDAFSQLNQALQMRERLGDREGAELTRHNLGQIGGGPGSNGGGGNGGGPWRPRLGVVLAVVAALAVLIVGGVVLASQGGGGGDKPPQLSAPAGHTTHSANRGPTRQTSPTTPAGEAGSTTPTCPTGPTGTSSISGNTCISAAEPAPTDGVSGTSDGVSGTADGALRRGQRHLRSAHCRERRHPINRLHPIGHPNSVTAGDKRMPAENESAGKFDIQIGDVSHSQVVIGDYNRVTQKVGLSPEDAEKLRGLFEGLRSSVEKEAPSERRGEAVAKADELERAVVSERPDVGRVRTVLRWFRDNAPQLAGAVVSVVVNPLVGKVVEGAGEAVADQFKEMVKEETS